MHEASSVLTPRLEIRLPKESDRSRFVDLFCDEEFMVFAGGVFDPERAHRRFDRMLVNADELTFAKQPVIERATGVVVGYVGVDWFDFEGERRLEFGWRLVPEARGRGYATEASRCVLEVAADTFRGEILAMIDPTNHPSQGVARKLGFTYWKMAEVGRFLDQIWRLRIGAGE